MTALLLSAVGSSRRKSGKASVIFHTQNWKKKGKESREREGEREGKSGGG